MMTKAIIPVAGLGTRFLPATKAQPKEMLPIIDKPVIQYLVEEAVASGITDIIFVTGRRKRAIEDHFDYAPELESKLLKGKKTDALKAVRQISDMARFSYVRQKSARGNGDAVLCASHLADGQPVAVLFGDDIVRSKTPCLLQLIRIFERYQGPVIALMEVPKKDVRHYGVVKAKRINSNIYEIKDMIEKPEPDKAPSNLAIVGKYIITKEVFEELKKLRPSRRGEIDLLEGIRKVLKKRPVYGVKFEGTRYDCGSKIGFLKAAVDFGLKHPEVKKDFRKYLKTLK